MDISSEAYAKEQDAQDELKSLRDDFLIPTRGDLQRKTLAPSSGNENAQPSTYLCGNSLGLQPRLTAKYQQSYLDTWATKGVYGHFTEIEDSPLPPWLDVDSDIVPSMAAIVGAEDDEIAVMQTLTANLHLAMSSFYRPTPSRWKIIFEGKAFPSDHYAIESQLRHHNIDPAAGMITINPSTPTRPILTTSQILSVIDTHASETALLLLPGIQFYTGQFFDIKTITAHAQQKGITVGWDLAHAAGNVPLHLHDWNVDFAAWCSYKYLNSGPGSIAGLFIHNRHSGISTSTTNSATTSYVPRLSGWWGSQKSTRFAMENKFNPIPGAGGWQLSNPSVSDMTALRASLDIFSKTSVAALRTKSLHLTAYLETLLLGIAVSAEEEMLLPPEHQRDKLPPGTFETITPTDPEARGAQLSVRLAPGLLDTVMAVLEEEGVVVDERRPDVIRVAPAPLYNNWSDVLRFVVVFKGACGKALEVRNAGWKVGGNGEAVMVKGGEGEKGWSEIK